MNNLLVLTKNFPFNTSANPAEFYLETEIPVLARQFDKVLVVATEAAVSEWNSCEFPDNVSVIALGEPQDKWGKARLALQACFFVRALKRSQLHSRIARLEIPAFLHELLDALSDQASTIKQKIFRDYFVYKAYRKFSRLQRIIEDFKPTCVYSFWFFDIALTAVFIKLMNPDVYAVSRAHRYDLYAFENKLNYLPCREFLYRHLDAIFPCSQNGTDYLSDLFKDAGLGATIKTAYLGTPDVELSAPSGSPDLRIVSCSRMEPVKRVGLLARALMLCAQKNMRIAWTHIGDGSCSEEIHNIVVDAPFDVRFTGQIENQEVRDLYLSETFDLFVNVSESEGLPLSIMEATAFGIPVLATDVGGTSELVKDGYNGWLISKQSTAQEIADVIESIARLKDVELTEFRDHARMSWDAQFKTTKNALHFARFLLRRGDLDEQ